MKNIKRIALIIALALLIGFAINNKTYSKYVLNRNFDVSLSSASFYFDATSSSNKIIFPRTTPSTDTTNILTTTTNFNLIIHNNDGSNFNQYDVTYKISLVDSPKFALDTSDTNEKTLSGGSLVNESIPLNLKIVDLANPSKKLTVRVTSTYPYAKSVDLTFDVVQEGAIQTIEDMVDITLAIRGEGNKYTRDEVIAQRFKMTRNLDFENPNSYENAYRTDYGNTNMDDYTDNLITELTTNAGFLPIGELEHPFSGTFNGDGHSISNLLIHKSLQINIGMFGTTNNANLLNFTIISGDVVNTNQTAGMVVGKVVGGLLENITVDGTSVMSTDLLHTAEDTYTGGIAGYVQSTTIRNCVNKATVTTNFTGDTAKYSGPAGGIVAWMAHSTIENCKNYGEVSGQSYIGGIAGFSGMQLVDGGTGGGTIRNCENYGYIHHYIPSGTMPSNWGKHIGGIAGYNKAAGIVEGNKNGSNISSDPVPRIFGITNVGGIVGNNAGTMRNNTNYSSNITGSSHYGRIYGYSNGTSSGDKDLSS